MPAPPLVSIVTPVYNGAKFLPEAIESVLSQDYPNFEYIVADGGSTDGTIEILERYRGRLRYFSGKDKGPSDAVRLGFLQASGEILAWLNSDDLYLPGALRAAAEYLAAHPEVDVIYGEGRWIDEKGVTIRRYPTRPFDPRLLESDCFICQPAAFFRSPAYRLSGGLDPEVRLPFDYDLWIRMAKAGASFAALPNDLALSRMHRGALTIGRRDEVFRASMELLRRHYGYIPLPWVFGYTAYLADGRDQFFEPLQPSFRKYLASLPAGFRYNPGRRLRFLGEWLSAPLKGLSRRLHAPME